MGKTRKDAMHHVISFRVNNEEREFLNLLAEQHGLSISTLIRANLNLTEEKAPRQRCVNS